MSKNLGPIHFMMYEKIKFQDKITSYLMDGNTEVIDKDFPKVSDKPLEDLVDQENIHGWLSARIDMVENRLARAISLSKNPEEKFYELGKIEGAKEKLDSLEEVFDKLNLRLLDGMPCDRALSAGLDDKGNLLLITNANLHKKYEEEMVDPQKSINNTCEGGHDHDSHESFEIGKIDKIENTSEKSRYHDMRYQFIKGFLEKSPYSVEKINGLDFKIFKKS
ncbi:hypothetical protein [Anaerococcus tetradius]|uniref:hypothetical protein n=1 Tax=Anaerococcus tetradius TaxID=33036 RepID=UPI0023F4BF8D|nr:hypothetical protein [Anaerococcus tetradius]